MVLDTEAQRQALLGILEGIAVRGADSMERYLALVEAIRAAKALDSAAAEAPWWKFWSKR